MSSSLLRSAGDDEGQAKPSFSYSARSFLSVFGMHGKLQIACTKSVSEAEPGAPKAKHLEAIVDLVSVKPSEFEELLVAYDALTGWQQSKVVSVKILHSLLHLFQVLPSIVALHTENLSILVGKMRNLYLEQDSVIQRVALFLKNKVGLLSYDAYTVFVDPPAAAARGLTLATLDNAEKCTVASAMLNSQDLLLSLLRTLQGVEATGQGQARTVAESITCNAMQPTLLAEANSFFTIITSILRFMGNNSDQFSPIVVSALREQYDVQFESLKALFHGPDLQQQGQHQTSVTGQFPRTNPLLTEQQGGAKA
jgi:hypothetical protein